MRLVVGVNHAAPHHVGGSEKVVQQIVESMRTDYGIDCHVLSKFAKGKVVHNGVNVEKTRDGDLNFLSQLKSLKPDHFHVYSDSFVYWPTVLRHSTEIEADKSVVLVGMNCMRSHPDLARIFKNKQNEFKTVTHSSNYLDYQACEGLGITPTVIHNAIDLNEFKDQGFSFREKHKIQTEHIILCVSNFFPGKAQEHLDHILRKLAERRKDFTAVFICSTVNYQPANALRMKHAQILGRNAYPSRLLVDISRQETVQAFREASIFAFPSQIEVAPLVVLESMAVGLPWVALNVGNVPTLSGGFIVNGESKSRGMWQYTPKMYQEFTDRLDEMLGNKELRKKIGDEGQNRILADYDWKQIRRQYYKLFTGKEPS
jgi:glycosyltransferase involved in cell wall biosynthesis